jgi:transposase
MKKIIIVLVLLGFLGTAWFVVNKLITIQAANNRPKTEKEIHQIAFYKKNSKKLGQPFTIDSIAITIDSYKYLCFSDKTTLYCKLTLTNNSKQNQRLMASRFALKNDFEVDFFPEEGYRFLLPNTTKKQILIYNLPPRILPYLAYWMHFESNINTNEKAIVCITTCYRSKG